MDEIPIPTKWEERRIKLQKEAIKQAFLELGIDISEPIEAQKDFAWIRSRRKAEESVAAKALVTAVGVIVTGVVGALLIWLKGIFGK